MRAPLVARTQPANRSRWCVAILLVVLIAAGAVTVVEKGPHAFPEGDIGGGPALPVADARAPTVQAPARLVAALKRLGAPAPDASDVVRLNEYTTWISPTPHGPIVSVLDLQDTSKRIGSVNAPLSLGCSPPPPGTMIWICGGNQDPGVRSLFVGRADPRVSEIHVEFPHGAAAHRISYERGLFVVVGPRPRSATEYGPGPIAVVGIDDDGEPIGRYIQPDTDQALPPRASLP